MEKKRLDWPGWTLLFVRPSGLETKNRVLCRFLTIMKVIFNNGLFMHNAKGKGESFYHTPSPRILYLCRHSAMPALHCPSPTSTAKSVQIFASHSSLNWPSRSKTILLDEQFQESLWPSDRDLWWFPRKFFLVPDTVHPRVTHIVYLWISVTRVLTVHRWFTGGIHRADHRGNGRFISRTGGMLHIRPNEHEDIIPCRRRRSQGTG